MNLSSSVADTPADNDAAIMAPIAIVFICPPSTYVELFIVSGVDNWLVFDDAQARCD